MKHTPYLVLALGVIGCAARETSDPLVLQQPETSTGFRTVERSESETYMVSTANPAATRAGVQILEDGGSAVDAAIAAQMVLTLVEPQSSGIGGGAFLLHYGAETGAVLGYDGREQAPYAMGPKAFLKQDGAPLGFKDAVIGGLSVGAPGVVAALEQAHDAHGKLPWSKLFRPAIELARKGWSVHPRMANGLKTALPLIDYTGVDSTFFDEEGNTREVGERVTNPRLAQTFELLSEHGTEVFYRGAIAEEIVDVVRSAKRPGLLTLDDLARYSAELREGLCVPYRDYRLCGFPPPAGSLVSITLLKLLERYELSSMEPNGPEFLHLYAQASELAYSDRDAYYADPAHVSVPVDALLDPERIAAGSALIRSGERSPEPMRMPPVDVARDRDIACDSRIANGPGPSELASTSHITIFDAEGNVVSMTSSVESNFGSKTMAAGFVLNNQLTDFEFVPCVDGALKANAARPTARPRSSMSPVIVLDSSGAPVLGVGSPGGAAIISYTAQTLIAVLDWDKDPQDAVSLPHILGRNAVTILEKHPALDAATAEFLQNNGHTLKRVALTSGISAVQREQDRLRGGADPRRDGVAAGD